MNKTRLLLLADALETRIPADRFDLADWRRDADDSGTVDNDELLHNCGTAGCAVGWACALDEFKAEGLTWDFDRPLYRVDAFIHHGNWKAVEKFFEIDEDEAERLFAGYQYEADDRTNPLAVAKRIREFVKEA